MNGRVAVAGLLGMLAAGSAQAACRLALVLALDVSASVDDAEYRLQTTGLARALTSADVQAALLADPTTPVWVTAFEWSSPFGQTTILDWHRLDTPDAIAVAAGAISGARRQTRAGRTALGAALLHAGARLQAGPACDRQTVDVAADGSNNIGPEPLLLKGEPALAGVTVNALTIGNRLPLDTEVFAPHRGGLADWFRKNVIRGPGAFVETADTYDDFAPAMRRKLLREIGAFHLSEASQ